MRPNASTSIPLSPLLQSVSAITVARLLAPASARAWGVLPDGVVVRAVRVRAHTRRRRLARDLDMALCRT